MTIRDWHWDQGKSHYMSAIDKWSEPRRPCWRCRWFTLYQDRAKTDAMRDWFEDNYTEDQYDLTRRFNGGNPYTAIEIYDEAVAIAFKLRYSDDFVA